jgi:hypothetical protein
MCHESRKKKVLCLSAQFWVKRERPSRQRAGQMLDGCDWLYFTSDPTFNKRILNQKMVLAKKEEGFA